MAKPLGFNARNWFWKVGGSTTQVYSSGAGNFVPVSNSQYQAWLAQGNVPTSIADEISLGRVLADYTDIITRPIPAGVLDGFKTQLSDYAERIFRTILQPTKLNTENRIRACERITGLSTAPNLTGAELKQLLKDLA